MRGFVFFFSALALAAPVLAATTPPGVNIRWDNCYDDGGALNKGFACDTNLGSERLVVSFVLDAAKSNVSGHEIVVDLTTTGPTLPSWWQLKNLGTCRQTSLGFSLGVPPGTANCQDWAGGEAAGGIGAYTIGFATPATARLLMATAVPASSYATLSAGTEYFVTQVTINHAKTVGTGACAGCAEPVCIVLNNLNITSPNIAEDLRLLKGANGTDSQYVHWQGALVQGLHIECPSPFRPCVLLYGCVLASTSARSSTWGAVKALYR
jgi:hypothetical protein